jgi:hypothetical protein
MVRFVSLVVLLGVLIALGGCAAAQPQRVAQPSSESVAPAAPPQPAQSPPSAANADKAATGGALASTDALQADAKRMIVRTDDLSLIVTDAQAALDSINSLAGSLGGYIAGSNTWRENEQLRSRVTVRLPADKLDTALADIKKLAVRVEKENLSGQDVTEEFTDLGAQLKNLEATEVELRQLLTDVREKTQRAEDVLQVYRELETTRGEIERVKGRMQYLSQTTALATLNIDLIPDILAKPVIEAGWRPLETARNAGRQLVVAMQGLVSAAIWLVLFVVPILIVLAIPIVLLVLFIRWLRRRSRRPRVSPVA